MVIANIFGYSIEDCLEVIRVLNEAPGIAMYELNASCPNTSHGGMVFGTDPGLLYELVSRCKGASAEAVDGEAVAERDEYRADGAGVVGCGGGCGFAGEYVCVVGD